ERAGGHAAHRELLVPLDLHRPLLDAAQPGEEAGQLVERAGAALGVDARHAVVVVAGPAQQPERRRPVADAGGHPAAGAVDLEAAGACGAHAVRRATSTW